MARRTAAAVRGLSLFIVAVCAAAGALAQPAVQGVVSRMSHGGTIFDIPLPQTGAGGIECRTVSIGMNVVVTFHKPVTAGAATVTAGNPTVGAVTFTGGTMSIPPAGLTNAQA